VTFNCVWGLKPNMAQRQLAFDTLLYWDQKRIDIDVCVVMDTLAHSVFRLITPTGEIGIMPFSDSHETLSKIQHSIKSFSSKQINKSIGKNRNGLAG
jgi:hypothetical protein